MEPPAPLARCTIRGCPQRWPAGTPDHDSEKKDRVSGRRWLVGIGVAGIASLAAMTGLLLDLVQHIH